VALHLDALGREVDEQGALIARTTAAAPTLKVNARAVKAVDLSGALERARREIAAEQAASRSAPAPGFDPRFETLQKHSAARQKRGLQFLEPGKLTEAAETSRVAAALREALGGEDAVRKAALRAKRHADELAKAASYEAAGAARQQGADQPASLAENVPEHEPWDAVLLAGASYEDVLSGRAAMAPNKISVYVEHPVPLPPPAEAPPPPPQPLRLTAKEQKKLRTQRRIAKEKERQDMLRQGLLEPPPPKVRIANLMRVLGAEATADPTAVEREVRLQVAERQAAHEDRNAARQLTPQERREKAMRKMFEESHGASDTLCCVYRVERLDSRLNEYKVLLNAEENHLTGAGFKTESFALIIVEGARKAIVRFNKLMLRRMDWALQQQLPGPDDPDDPRSVEACQRAAEEYEAKLEAQGPNKCTLVWQGVVLKPAFKRFKFELIKTAAGTAQYLQELGLRHLWDLAAAGVPIE
jgi:U4/U6 small nuclear ribonucleoprotein PRP3